MERTVVVTGANRGIGLEYARQLSDRGERVIATARRPAEASELRGLDVDVRQLDVADPDSVAAFASGLDTAVDVLINNAGVGVRGQSLGSISYDQMRHFFEVNTCGPLRMVEALKSRLDEGASRRIVNMTSRMGSIEDNSSGGSYAYRASKAALNIVNRSLARDLGDQGYVCVVLHPGWVQTDMGGSSAPTTPEESVSGLLRVIDGLGPPDNGRFYDFTGEELPW